MYLSYIKIIRELKKYKNDSVDEIGTVIDAFTKFIPIKIYGSRSILRIIFPNIDYISSLRYGTENKNDVVINSIKFIKEYMAAGCDHNLKQNAGLIYYIYRHGLLHQAFPKNVSCKFNKKLIWSITLSKNSIPSKSLSSLIGFYITKDDFQKINNNY